MLIVLQYIFMTAQRLSDLPNHLQRRLVWSLNLRVFLSIVLIFQSLFWPHGRCFLDWMFRIWVDLWVGYLRFALVNRDSRRGDTAVRCYMCDTSQPPNYRCYVWASPCAYYDRKTPTAMTVGKLWNKKLLTYKSCKLHGTVGGHTAKVWKAWGKTERKNERETENWGLGLGFCVYWGWKWGPKLFWTQCLSVNWKHKSRTSNHRKRKNKPPKWLVI